MSIWCSDALILEWSIMDSVGRNRIYEEVNVPSLGAFTWDVLSETRPSNYHVWYNPELELEIDVKVSLQSVNLLTQWLFFPYLRWKNSGFQPKTTLELLSEISSALFLLSVLYDPICWIYVSVHNVGCSSSVQTLNGLGIGANGPKRWLIGLIWDSTYDVFQRLCCRKSLGRKQGRVWSWNESQKSRIKKEVCFLLSALCADMWVICGKTSSESQSL